MKISESLVRKFIKDTSLPIPVFSNPYFDYFINLYEDYAGSKTKYNEFLNLIEKLGEESFFETSRKITDSIIYDIKNNPFYIIFNETNLDKSDIDFINKMSSFAQRKEFFKRDLANKDYISIDLKKANFQTLNEFDSEIFNSDSYEEYFSKFTNEKYFINSKQIRQVIFGNLNCKKITAFQRKIIANIVSDLFDLGVDSNDLIVFLNDEIIISNENNKYSDITSKYVNNSNLKLHLENFKLTQIHSNYSFFSKDFNDGSFVLKAVPVSNFAEVYKFKTHQKINDFDLVFNFEGRISKYNEPLLKKND